MVEDNGEAPAAPPAIVSGTLPNPGNVDTETCETNTLMPNRASSPGTVEVR